MRFGIRAPKHVVYSGAHERIRCRTPTLGQNLDGTPMYMYLQSTGLNEAVGSIVRRSADLRVIVLPSVGFNSHLAIRARMSCSEKRILAPTGLEQIYTVLSGVQRPKIIW